MTTVLVRSGIADEDAIAESESQPDHVVDHLGQIDRVLG